MKPKLLILADKHREAFEDYHRGKFKKSILEKKFGLTVGQLSYLYNIYMEEKLSGYRKNEMEGKI